MATADAAYAARIREQMPSGPSSQQEQFGERRTVAAFSAGFIRRQILFIKEWMNDLPDDHLDGHVMTINP